MKNLFSMHIIPAWFFSMSRIGLFIISTILFTSCNNSKDNGKLKLPGDKYLGNRMVMDDKAGEVVVIKKWDMPPELLEISGLSHLDESRLACVQDELGKIFIYNITDNKVEREINFGPVGDYEGLAVAGSDIWVLRADGVLFEVKDIQQPKPLVQSYNTHLTIKENAEGLCYDPATNRLLVAVKAKDPNSTDYKGIYAFDLSSRTMAKTPVFRLDLGHEVFSVAETGKKKKKKGTMMPSGIAIHPITRDMYITDGPQSRLLITNAAGDIKRLFQLDPKIFAQPEGIIFNTNGDLFISNEGLKEPGNIMQVQLQNTQ